MWDEYGCCICLKYNGGNHIQHSHSKPHDPSTIPIPTQFLEEEKEETVQQVVDSACDKAAGRNYMFCRFGKFSSSMKVTCLHHKENKSKSKEDDNDSK